MENQWSNIPQELKELPQWVCYMMPMNPEKGKPDKVPINPHTLWGASSTKPGTWSTFQEAVTQVGKEGHCKRKSKTISSPICGVGFVFNGNGIVGVDFDHCYNDDVLDPWVGEWVRRFNSYVEFSPSGTGLHILCYGKLPGKTVKLDVAEMYDVGRFFTVTGKGPSRPLCEAQEAINALYEELQKRRSAPAPVTTPPSAPFGAVDLDDVTLIDKAKHSRNGAQFAALWDGDISGYSSHSEADLALCNWLAWWTNRDPQRVDKLFRQSGLMREDKWDRRQSGTTYGALTIQEAIASCSGGYDPQAHFQRKAEQITADTTTGTLKLSDLHPDKNERYGWNDIGNGNLFADWYKEKARYVPERKRWYIYSGKVWEPDTGGLRAMELCKALADALAIYALSIPDEQQRIAYQDHVRKWQRRNNRETILKDAASVYPVSMTEFDQDPYLFNCKNGTLDLRTRDFRPHSPADLLATISGVKYDPAARSELWEKTISEVMQGDQDTAAYLQKAMGYGLTGDTSEEAFFLLYGATTRNGKGTLMETYMALQGGYGRAARPETIAQKEKSNSNAPTEDIARLAGARVVNISEPDKKMVLSASLVKTLTGRDTINARFLNENSFEFVPQFKLFVNTNHLPKVTDPTVFDSGRVKVIPFNRHFSEKEQDKGLKRKLRQPENLSGILNWCLDGLWMMRETGLDTPKAVREATAQYRQDSDKIARFVADMLEPDPHGEIRTEEAYQQYQDWCFRNGHMAENMANWRQAMEAHVTIRKKRPAGAGREASKLALILGLKWRCGPMWSGNL